MEWTRSFGSLDYGLMRQIMHESYDDSKFRVDPGTMFLLESSARNIPEIIRFDFFNETAKLTLLFRFHSEHIGK